MSPHKPDPAASVMGVLDRAPRERPAAGRTGRGGRDGCGGRRQPLPSGVREGMAETVRIRHESARLPTIPGFSMWRSAGTDKLIASPPDAVSGRGAGPDRDTYQNDPPSPPALGDHLMTERDFAAAHAGPSFPPEIDLS